jgi:hypothetical protein
MNSVQLSVKHMLYSFTILLCYSVNPCLLKGHRTGVFVRAIFSETEQVWCCSIPHENGYVLTGCVRAMFANQISYWLGITGKLSLILNNKIVVECRVSDPDYLNCQLTKSLQPNNASAKETPLLEFFK